MTCNWLCWQEPCELRSKSGTPVVSRARITEVLEHDAVIRRYYWWSKAVLDGLQMGDDGEEASTNDGYHSLTLHSVASSAAHHTGNPFAAGNTPRISAGESSTSSLLHLVWPHRLLQAPRRLQGRAPHRVSALKPEAMQPIMPC